MATGVRGPSLPTAIDCRNGVDENDGSSLMLTHALGDQRAPTINVSSKAAAYLASLGFSTTDGLRLLLGSFACDRI
jgi:hypothetical protein